MILLIDIGNTRVKWVTYAGQTLESYQWLSLRNSDWSGQLASIFTDMERPVKVVAANVAGPQAAEIIAGVIPRTWQVTPEFVHTGVEFAGLKNGYRDPAQLGIDRWAAMVAAWIECGSAFCLVSCGTAITVDLVNDTGMHLGGYIIPGIDLMRDSLLNATGLIKSYDLKSHDMLPGTTTTACVNNGTSKAAASLVDRVLAEARSDMGEELSCKLTGGAAEVLDSLIDEKFENDPMLVLKGLELITREKL